jgi:hypothetical protein
MKKYIYLIIVCFTLFAVGASAQSTTPRYGTGANQDNTGRILTYKYVSLTDAVGADSVIARPREYSTLYRVVLVDSFTFKQPVITSCYAGDYITIVASAASGTPKMKFTGSNWITAGTATLSTGLRAVIRLVFDGAKWVEVSRVVQ